MYKACMFLLGVGYEMKCEDTMQLVSSPCGTHTQAQNLDAKMVESKGYNFKNWFAREMSTNKAS